MPENWQTFKIDNVFPPEVRTVVEAVSTVTGTLTEILNLTKTALEITSALAQTAASNPMEEAINAAVSEIEQFIDDLTQSTAAHAILIPIQKQYFGRGQRRPATDLPPEESIVSSTSLENDGRFREPPSAVTARFINNAPTASGGNEGFWRALAVSLLDEGDFNKPEFPSNFAVAGAAIIFGATSYAELQENFDLFSQLLNVGSRTELAGNTRPTLENLRGRAVPITSVSPARIGVQLDWDPVPTAVGIPLYSDEQIIVEEMFIVRSTDPAFREQFSWNQAFSRQPKDETTDLQAQDKIKVVARVLNDGFTVRYVDQDPTLLEGNAYYYGVALRYSIDGIPQPMGNFSNVIRVEHTGRCQSTRRSVAPDWWASPSLIALFPDLEALINIVKLEIAGLNSRSGSNSGPSAIINQTINQINTLVEQGEELLAKINNTTAKLAALTNKELNAATSSTTLSVSSGGMDAWMGQLAARLADTTDPTRPPFDNGELVSGVVIVAGAPNLPLLQPFLDLLALFFGSGDDNPIIRAVDSVEAITREAEVVVFGEDMAPSRVSDPTAEVPPRVAFSPEMTPKEDCL